MSFTDTSAPAPTNPVAATPATNPPPVASPATNVAPTATSAPTPAPVISDNNPPAVAPTGIATLPAAFNKLDFNQMLAENLKDVAAQRAEAKKDKEMNKKYGLDRLAEIDKLKENYKD